MSCSSISGSSDDTSADVAQTQDPTISTIEDAQHNQEPAIDTTAENLQEPAIDTAAENLQESAIDTTAENLQEQELSGDTNTAMPQIHDSTADTNANEEQAQAS